MKTEPVIVEISDIYALAIPKIAIQVLFVVLSSSSSFCLSLFVPHFLFQYDPIYEEEKLQNDKQQQLDEFEQARLDSDTGDDPTSEQKDANFAAKLATKIIANLQLTVKNVHIRYEDFHSNPGAPFAVGVTLSSLMALSADSNWNFGFVKNPGEFIHKLVAMGSLAVYWNSNNPTRLAELSDVDFQNAFKDGIAMPAHIPRGFNYILKPISAKCKLRLNTNKKATMGIPKVDVDLGLEALELDLRQENYQDVLLVTCAFADFFKSEKFRKFRPASNVRPTGKAGTRIWWKYAITCILTKIRERKRKWSWVFFKGENMLHLLFFCSNLLLCQRKD